MFLIYWDKKSKMNELTGKEDGVKFSLEFFNFIPIDLE